MPKSGRIGAYYESRARKMLEELGYVVVRAAGSKGPFDLIAIGPTDVRCIQVKAGDKAWISPAEREAIELIPVLRPMCTKEIWRMQRRKPPAIERV